ncbi:MFS general substrate transporter [Rhodocollybia butyracea]|uniref:MFS general substrate transporter n=1 Tax=Rhodocollybia butyracea TaxID=206335 RepID=A0A9P5U716_9AGAR|nr:MFS general substrate transporter [Rhodocollybia butyracea]
MDELEKNSGEKGVVFQSEEKASPVSGRFAADSISSRESDTDGDDALKLVGKERTVEFSDEFNRKLRWKLDLLIPPLCGAVYLTQFLDKTSLNYASIMGLPITGQHYNLVALAFYIGFLAFEFPSVYLSQKSGKVAKYLGANIVIWGAVMMLHAVGTSFGAFFTLRVLLGMCESCTAPSLILIISMFYKKDEQATRISWFYVMVHKINQNGLSQIFGGFVAYGVSFSENPHIAPFKIIYVLLGGLAMLVGFAVLLWMPDSPMTARFLTEEERIACLERVRNDQGGVANKSVKKGQIVEAFTDIRLWLIVLSTLLVNIPNGISSFSNLVIESFGYTSRQTLILSTPAGAFACASTLLCGWYSDRKNERMVPIVFALIPTIVGAAMLVALNDSGKKGALLFAIYLLGTSGSTLSTIYAYNASNTSGYTKKSTVNAVTLITFGIANIVGSETFLPKDAPDYIPGKISILVLLIAQLFVSFLLRWINLRLNKKKTAQIEELKRRNGWNDADVQKEREKHAFMDLTDKENIYFVYTA